MKRILCYGDSNTWGYIPGTIRERYEPDVRWTGVAQKLLGSDYLLIEEGLNGRTTVYDNPCKPWENGMDMLPGMLITQKPLDLAIFMLGTNDLWQKDAFAAAEGMRALLERTYEMHKPFRAKPYTIFNGDPRILVVSPILVHEVLNAHDGEHHRKAAEESKKFARLYKQVSAEMETEFMDAALYAQPSPVDGIHMDPDSHRRLGEAMAQKIRELLEK